MSTTTTTSGAGTTNGPTPLPLGDWIYFLMSISWIFTAISFTVCCYAVYAGYKHYQHKKATSKNATRLSHQLKVIVLTIICMWIFTAINICDSIGLPHSFSNVEGDWEHVDKSYLMWNVFWAIAKITLYLVYLHRIYTIFGGTKYAPSQGTYCVILIVLVVQTVLVCLWCWFYNISWSCCQIWADNQYEILALLAWWILIIDIFLTIGLVFLFLYCMKQLFGAINEHKLSAISGGIQMNEVTIGSKSEPSADSKTNIASTTEQTQSEAVDAGDTSSVDRQTNLVKTTTRVFVLAIISLLSSIFYQLLFGIALTEEFYNGSHVHTAFYYFSFTWNVDSTLNVICLYLSMAFAKGTYYKIVKCDGCCYNCIQKMTT